MAATIKERLRQHEYDPMPDEWEVAWGDWQRRVSPGKQTLTQRLAIEIYRYGQPAPASTAAPVQRKSAPAATVAMALPVTTGGGAPLHEDLRRAMEQSFGASFSTVRVHECADAALFGILAYTRGDDIYFAPGQYDPDSVAGQELIGHELTHVLQQRAGRVVPGPEGNVQDDPGLEREADDMGARAARGLAVQPGADGVSQPAVASLPGPDPAIQARREDVEVRGEHHPVEDPLDPSTYVYFDLRGVTLSPEQAQRVRDMVARIPEDERGHITLRGHASEEGNDASGRRLAARRVEAVAQALIDEGIADSAITRDLLPQASRGRIDYREWRAVEIVAGGAHLHGPDCAQEPTIGTLDSTQRATLDGAIAVGVLWVGNAITALQNHHALRNQTPPPPVLPAVAELFGPDAPIEDLINKLEILRGLLGTETSQPIVGTRCHDSCQAGNEAFELRGHITVCPGLFENNEEHQLARILIHETAHLPGLDTIDVAYGYERLSRRLSNEDAHRNADSFAMLVIRLNEVTDLPRSMPVEDALGGLPTEAEREQARSALAYLERWVHEGDIMTSWLYGRLNDGLTQSPPQWPSDLVRDKLLVIGHLFHVPVSRHRPTERNRTVLAAIYDRYVRLRRVVREPIEVVPATSDTTVWEPGPGRRIQAAPALWMTSPREQVRLLLGCLASVSPDISSELVPAYVELTDDLTKVRNLGP